MPCDTHPSPVPPLTVAICSSQRGKTLTQTLEGLLPEALSLHAELLVIDQAHEHPPKINHRLLAWERQGTIRWIRTCEDSLTGKRNVALRESHSNIILFVDDDVLVPTDFLSRHLKVYENHQIAGVTGQVYHAMTPGAPPSLQNPKEKSRPHFTSTSPTQTRSFIGCNHSVLKSAARAIGGYDEQFIGSSQCEDFDFADRLADAGYTLWYDPEAWLIHLRERTGGTRGTDQWPEWTRTANIFLYLFRHGKSHSRIALLWRTLRTGPLRKEVVASPRTWLSAWVACFKGLRYGWKNRHFKPAL